jgi:hypothetical protein
VFGHHSIFFDKKDRQGKIRNRSTLVLLAIKTCAICKVGRRSLVRPSPPRAQKAPTPGAESWRKSAFFALLRTWVVTTTKNAQNENYYFLVINYNNWSKWCDFNNISLYIMKNFSRMGGEEKKLNLYHELFHWNGWEEGKKNLTRYILDMEILVQAQIGEHPWRCCKNWMGFRLWIQIGCLLRRWGGGVTTSQDLWPLNFPCMIMSLGSSIKREKIGGFSVHDLGCRDRSSHGAGIRE